PTGDVIGINPAVTTDSNGIGFAIPIDIARPIMRQALAGAELARPYIGVRYEPVDRQVQEDETLSMAHGAWYSEGGDAAGQTLPAIVPGGPADAAGVKKGDIITRVGNLVVDSEHPLDLVLASFAPGQTVDLELLRGRKTVTVTLTLGPRPSDL